MALGISFTRMAAWIALLALPATALAETRSDCFKRHVEEAIASNQARMPLYSAAGGGLRSRVLSEIWIGFEKVALAAENWSYHFDRRARPYQEAGIGILCDEFAEMSSISGFQAPTAKPWPELSQFKKANAASAEERLWRSHQTRDFKILLAESKALMNEISAEPRFNCMTRHLLESIARAAALAPVHRQKALQAGLPDSSQLSLDLIASQIRGLSGCARLDNLAAPLQSEGLPIICADVPAIEIP